MYIFFFVFFFKYCFKYRGLTTLLWYHEILIALLPQLGPCMIYSVAYSGGGWQSSVVSQTNICQLNVRVIRSEEQRALFTYYIL